MFLWLRSERPPVWIPRLDWDYPVLTAFPLNSNGLSLKRRRGTFISAAYRLSRAHMTLVYCRQGSVPSVIQFGASPRREKLSSLLSAFAWGKDPIPHEWNKRTLSITMRSMRRSVGNSVLMGWAKNFQECNQRRWRWTTAHVRELGRSKRRGITRIYQSNAPLRKQ